jgi:hypothetical protein
MRYRDATREATAAGGSAAVAPLVVPVLAPAAGAGHPDGMTVDRRGSSTARRVLPWVVGWLALQGAGALAGLVLARRKDEGDDSTAGIRRVRVMGGTELHPHNPELSRVRLDLVMAGGEVDLGGLSKVPGGVDVTVRAYMAGAVVRVPGDWRVWVRSRGMGGVEVDPRLERTDERGADLRVHATVVAAGLALERT